MIDSRFPTRPNTTDTPYEPEFEAWWTKQLDDGPVYKALAYAGWQAGRKPPTPNPIGMDLKGGNWAICTADGPHAVNVPSRPNHRIAGLERATEEMARRAAEKMWIRDRLHAFVTEYEGEEYQWTPNQANWYIFRDGVQKWEYASAYNTWTPGLVYMRQETAKALAKALSEGRLVL